MFIISLKKDEKIITSKNVRGYFCKIGRSPFSDIILDEPYISSEHLVIVVVFGLVFLIDKSLNGVFVNEQRIKKNVPVYINSDNEIKIGQYSITIQNIIDNSETKTSICFENLKDGIDIQKVLIIENKDNFIKSVSDAEFDLSYFTKKYTFEDIYRDELLRLISLKSRKDSLYVILFSNSIYNNQDFTIDNKKVFRLKNMDYLIFFSLAIIFLISIGLIIYLSLR